MLDHGKIDLPGEKNGRTYFRFGPNEWNCKNILQTIHRRNIGQDGRMCEISFEEFKNTVLHFGLNFRRNIYLYAGPV